MPGLEAIRQGWEVIEREEASLARDLTIEQSVEIYLSLCHALAPMIEETKELYLPEREAYLTELQARIHKLAIWLNKQNEIATESS